jgi:hypothetical protein
MLCVHSQPEKIMYLSPCLQMQYMTKVSFLVKIYKYLMLSNVRMTYSITMILLTIALNAGVFLFYNYVIFFSKIVKL